MTMQDCYKIKRIPQTYEFNIVGKVAQLNNKIFEKLYFVYYLRNFIMTMQDCHKIKRITYRHKIWKTSSPGYHQ